MLDAKPNDPVTAAQVADLLRQAELTEPALELYRKAAALAPTNPQYHEYIGEYLHNLKRPDEAKAEWAKIAEGTNRNVKTLARLSEVFAGFGYLKEACLRSRSCRARARQLRSPAQARERSTTASKNLTTPKRSSPPQPSSPRKTRKKTPSSRLASRTTRPPTGWPQRIEALQKELEAARQATARSLDRAGPIPRGRRQAPRGRPRRRQGDRDRSALDPGLDARRQGARVSRQPG